MKSCSVWLHVNIPSGIYCGPYRLLHMESFAGLFFPHTLFYFPHPAPLFSFLLLHGVLQPAILPLVPNLSLFVLRWVVKNDIQLELLQLQSPQWRFFRIVEFCSLQWQWLQSSSQVHALCPKSSMLVLLSRHALPWDLGCLWEIPESPFLRLVGTCILCWFYLEFWLLVVTLWLYFIY